MSLKEGIWVVFFFFFSFINYEFIGQIKEIDSTNHDQLFSYWTNSLYQGERNVINLTCPPLDTVRIAVIGLGNRGQMALERLPNIKGVKVIAIADIDSNKVNSSFHKYFEQYEFFKPDRYYLENDWKEICKRTDIDLIYVCTHWDLHTPIAVYAMENNKHVAVEVPAALTVKECWNLVKTSEKTRKHCIQLENCMYDFFEISVLNMAQNNKFGELVHAEGAYIHDLRSLNLSLIHI